MPRLPRLTFLARFTLVTFVSAAVAAVLLTIVLETSHRKAVERDETLDAVARVEAVFTPLVDRLARETVPQPELARAARDADVFSYVIGTRLYDERGRAVFPSGSAPHPVEAASVAAKEAVVVVDRGNERMAYAPLATSDGSRTFVVAVVMSRGQMSVQTLRDRWVVFGTTGGAVALIFLSLIALATGASRELERRRREAEGTFVETLGVMARTLDLRDPYTAGHSERVADYSRAIAREMGLPERVVTIVHSSALLHDLGKIAVPDAVLFKPAKLEPHERAMIEVHPSVGASILASIRSMEDVVPCVMHHHERFAGGGYPDGLAGERIPLGARIIAVADAFDAMTTDRPYRRALSLASALAEIVNKTGTQFDDAPVAAFVALAARGAIEPPASLPYATFARKLEHQAVVG